MARTAFIILRSPHEQDPSHAISRFAAKADASAILIEDGVYQATLQPAATRLGGVASEVLVSGEDLEARGFSRDDLRIGKAVEYGDIVDCIMERTARSVTL